MGLNHHIMSLANLGAIMSQHYRESEGCRVRLKDRGIKGANLHSHHCPVASSMDAKFTGSRDGMDICQGENRELNE